MIYYICTFLISFCFWINVCMFVSLCGSQSEEGIHFNGSLEWRFHELEEHYAEATTLLHLQGTLILDLQVPD